MTDYIPTTDEVETAFHEFVSELETNSPGEYPEAPEFRDWREAMLGFRRWLARERAQAKAEALRESADIIVKHASRTDNRFTEHELERVGAVQWLRDRADELEGKQ